MSTSPIASEYSLFKMPRGLPSVIVLFLFSVIAFAIVYVTLVLYLRQFAGFAGWQANDVIGVFLAYNFVLHLLGAFVVGRYFSYRFFLLIALMLQIISGVLLSIGTHQMIFLGLTLLVLATGGMMPSINMLIAQFFSPADSRRETAFLWSYSAMNVGFLLGNLLSGSFQVALKYHALYLFMACVNVIPLAILVCSWPCLHDRGTLIAKSSQQEHARRMLLGFAMIALMIPVLYKLFQYPAMGKLIIALVGVGVFVYVIIEACRQTGSARKKIIVFLVLLLAAQIFWVISQLVPMGLVVFSQYNVERHLHGVLIAQGWIQSINSVTLILFGPLLVWVFQWMRRYIKASLLPLQYAIGLMVVGVGLLLLSLGIFFANEHGLVDFSWLFVSYFLLALGELFVAPIGYAMVGLLVPESLQSNMMGVVLFNAGVAAVLASTISNKAMGLHDVVDPLISNASYTHVFMWLSAIALGFSLIVFALTPLMQRMINATGS